MQNRKRLPGWKRITTFLLVVALVIGIFPGFSWITPVGAAPISVDLRDIKPDKFPYTITSNGTYVITTGGVEVSSGDKHGIFVNEGLDDVTIYLDKVNLVTNSSSTPKTAPSAMYIEGSRDNSNITTKVNIYLRNSNTLWSGENGYTSAAGVEVFRGAQVDFYDDAATAGVGELRAKCSKDNRDGAGAGIGAGNRYQSGGHMVFHSGKITAEGGYHGAGIGDAHGANMSSSYGNTYSNPENLWNGSILIYGGQIASYGGAHGAGIGGACYATNYGNPEDDPRYNGWNGQGTIIAIPSVNPDDSIVSKSGSSGSAPDLGAAGNDNRNVMYIGDPNQSNVVTVRTEDNLANVTMYMDLTDDPLVPGVVSLLGANDINISRVYFGVTGSNGRLEQPAVFADDITFFTDAENKQGFTYSSKKVAVEDLKGNPPPDVVLKAPIVPTVSIWTKADPYPPTPPGTVAQNPPDKPTANLNKGYQPDEDYVVVVVDNINSEAVDEVKVVFPGTDAAYDLPQYFAKYEFHDDVDPATRDKLVDANGKGKIPFNGSKESIIPAYSRAYIYLPLISGESEGEYEGIVRLSTSKTSIDNINELTTKSFKTKVGLSPVTVEKLETDVQLVGNEDFILTATFNVAVDELDLSKITITNGVVVAGSAVAVPPVTAGYAEEWTFKVKPAANLEDNAEIKVQVYPGAAKDKYENSNTNRSNIVTVKFSNTQPMVKFGFEDGHVFTEKAKNLDFTITPNGKGANADTTYINDYRAGYEMTVANAKDAFDLKKGDTLISPNDYTVAVAGNKVTITMITGKELDEGDYSLEMKADTVYNANNYTLEPTSQSFLVRIPIALETQVTNPDDPSGDKINAAISSIPVELEYTGGEVTITITGKNLQYAGDTLKIELPASLGGKKVVPTASADGTKATYKVVLPQNDSDVNVRYTFKGTLKDADIGNTFSTVKYREPGVYALGVRKGTDAYSPSVVLDDAGGLVDFEVDGWFLQFFEDYEIVNREGKLPTISVPSGGANYNTVEVTGINIPLNKEQKDVVYTFDLTKSNGQPTGLVATVTVKKPEFGVTSITATPDHHSAQGGTSTIDLTGLQMDVGNLEVRVPQMPSLNHTVSSFTNNGNNATFTMNFPVHPQLGNDLRNDIYVLEVWFDGVNTGLTAEVEVGNSIPSITGGTVVPPYYPSVNDTLNGKGKSVITVQGNYLENFKNIQIYDRTYGVYYTVNNAGCDETATYTVTIPSAVGIFQFDIWADGEDTGYFVQVGVGEQPSGGTYPGDQAGDPNETREQGGGNADKRGKWAGGGIHGGGGSKGGNFTGNFEEGFEVVRHQANQAGFADPKNPQMSLSNVALFTRKQFDMAAVGASTGAAKSQKAGKGALTIHFDTTSADELNKLEGRIYVKLDQPIPDVFPSVYVRDLYTKETKALFDSRFPENNIQVIHLDQNGSFGVADVEVAAKLDLTKLDTDSLYFYRLDRLTGKFELLKDTKQYIDTSGYLHFFTKIGGDIIVTDKPLTENGKAVSSGSFDVKDMPKILTPALINSSLGKKQQEVDN